MYSADVSVFEFGQVHVRDTYFIGEIFERDFTVCHDRSSLKIMRPIIVFL